jgi:hypothetical protein
MKAIINTKKTSGFSYLNGRTFEVKEVFTTFVAIQIPSQICYGKFDTCDFNHNEVIIVDIDAEVQKAYDDYSWGNDNKRYIKLKDYCISNRIKTNEQLTTIA